MQHLSMNGISVYNLSGKKPKGANEVYGKVSKPRHNQSKEEKEATKRAKREERLGAIDFVHELTFPVAPTTIKQTANGAYLFSTGGYPPQLHCYDVQQQSLKFNRHVDSEIVAMHLLSADYRCALQRVLAPVPAVSNHASVCVLTLRVCMCVCVCICV